MSDHTEPLVLINLFSMPAESVDGFIARWPDAIAPAMGAAGFRGTQLHRALDPDAPYPVVNVARWDSVEEWQAMVGAHYSGGTWDGPTQERARPQAALYQVVHVTPDPQQEAVARD